MTEVLLSEAMCALIDAEIASHEDQLAKLRHFRELAMQFGGGAPAPVTPARAASRSRSGPRPLHVGSPPTKRTSAAAAAADVLERLRAIGEFVTPRRISRELPALSAWAVRSALARLEQAGQIVTRGTTNDRRVAAVGPAAAPSEPAPEGAPEAPAPPVGETDERRTAAPSSEISRTPAALAELDRQEPIRKAIVKLLGAGASYSAADCLRFVRAHVEGPEPKLGEIQMLLDQLARRGEAQRIPVGSTVRFRRLPKGR